jgi:Uma2 family endonuclease
MQVHGYETPYAVAPEICIEIASPPNSTRALQEKIRAYLTAGAVEAWVLYPQSKRIEIFSAAGLQPVSNFVVDLTGVFD